MAGYPKVFNIEMDQHEDLNVFGLFPIASEPALKAVEEYLVSVKTYPNPPAPNVTQFRRGGGGWDQTHLRHGASQLRLLAGQEHRRIIPF